MAEPLKHIFLLRHAKSSWDDPDLADHDRPLADRGRRASEAMAKHLRESRISPALVLCSPSARTRETLERISPGWDQEPKVSVEDGLYGASEGELLARLRELPEDVESVMLIGHQPAIQELTLELAGKGAEVERAARKFPTAALATLEFAGPWPQLAPDRAELVGFVRPKDLSD
jgi:phosphohistidine phosphatase